MHKSNQILMKPINFKNMSSNFLYGIRHSMGFIEIYPVVPLALKSTVKKKPVIRFTKITPQGEQTWHHTSPKIHCYACRRFLQSFPSAVALGGRVAEVDVSPSLSKSARGLPHGRGPILSRSGKRYSGEKSRNDPIRDAPEAAAQSRPCVSGGIVVFGLFKDSKAKNTPAHQGKFPPAPLSSSASASAAHAVKGCFALRSAALHFALDLLARLRPSLLTTAAPREILPQAVS